MPSRHFLSFLTRHQLIWVQSLNLPLLKVTLKPGTNPKQWNGDHRQSGGIPYRVGDGGAFQCFCTSPHSSPILPSFYNINRSRCTVVAAVALGCAIPGAKGSQKRRATMTFEWQMKQPVGVANPNAFTAYYLPRYVRHSSPRVFGNALF